MAIFKPSNPGTKTRNIYRSFVNEDGTLQVVKSGEYDLQAEIQMDKDLCDVNLIMNRFAAGDPMASAQLSGRSGVYGDFTKVPKTYAEFLQMQIDGKAYFERLPAEIRQEYDNDYNQFLSAAMDDDNVVKLMDKLYPDLNPTEDDSKPDEGDEKV